uniref:Tissue inhibitor of metalloproteinase n=1 Tax=Nonomuraea gerenzanensis TaxID=93944 RepID=A0A1M4E8X7_9ACTN|nr:hypothetical protein BN4615_P4684 [Nonomuraea gerenzanensis]
MLRFLALLALAASILAGLSTAAHACSCANLTPAQAVRHADAVFTGTVTGMREAGGLGRPRVFTFRADQVYKGAPAAGFTLTTSADSASCGYAFERGGRYLVFAAAASSGPVVEGVELSSHLCSGNVPLDPGTGPLRPGDERAAGHESLAGPVGPELVEVLGRPLPPVATGETHQAAGPLRAERGAGVDRGWIAGGAVVVLAAAGTLLAFAARRRNAQ